MHKNEDDKFIQNIGVVIRQLRINAGYSSQETFAYDAEIPRAQYGRYEKGANITIKSLKKILIYHKLSFEAFFSLVEKL